MGRWFFAVPLAEDLVISIGHIAHNAERRWTEKGKKMGKLIDIDEAYKVLTDYYHHKTEIQHKALKEAIERVPIADATFMRHGHWVIDEDGNIKCSECGYHGVGDNYCERCGAKMDEVTNEIG